ncbi:MAG: hypothetical protein JWR63_4464 [Conexibacter sp.]|nr:hypothetical protein [Conexibacter sp.]
MTTVIDSIREALSAAWRLHFRIPALAYWLLIVVAGIGFSTASATEALAWGGVFLIGTQGVLRWRYHRRRARGHIVIARFDSPEHARDRARETQALFMTRLRDALTSEEAADVHAVPAVVGTDDAAGAIRLRRRTGARILVYGRIADSGDSGWAVFTRLVSPVGGGQHLDPHTRDVTPIKRTWAERVELLSSTDRVVADEYPLVAATELESIVRGTAGQAALMHGDLNRGVRLLSEALDVAPGSESGALDVLRVALAEAYAESGDTARSLALLRSRAASGTASPNLLRNLHRALSHSSGDDPAASAANRLESIAALREAAGHRSDPQRDMTLFNLASILIASHDAGEQDEAVEILQELERSSPRYARAWYVQRLIGAASWQAAGEADDVADRPTAMRHYREAGRRYARAIRLRPRFAVFPLLDDHRALWTRYPAPTILRANLADVHDVLGRRWRGRWQWWRCERQRDLRLRRGLRFFAQGDWLRAYINFDWVITGRWDFRDTIASVYSAVAQWQMHNDPEALAQWEQAVARQPYALITRAAMLRDPVSHPLERGLPGDEPTDLDVVMDQLRLPEPSPGPLPAMVWTWRTRWFPSHESTR